MQAPMLAVGADGTGCDTAAMFGMQVRMTARPGRGDRLADLLLQAAAALADDDRCALYVVSRVTGEPDVILVTEAWSDRAAHDASLETDQARALIAQAMPLIEGSQAVEITPAGKPL
jgi:quinol monooxygenase YgiN